MTRLTTRKRRFTAPLLSCALAWGLLAGPPAARADECHDALITAAVKARLVSDDVIGGFKINVDTDECVVTLNGCVDSRDQIRRARNLARRVRHVRAVKNNLTVCPAESEEKSGDK
jgi:hypothetical protein